MAEPALAPGKRGRTSPRRGRARRAREAHRRGRCELARLVRRVYGRGAGRSEASDVIEFDLIIGGSPGAYALGPEAGALLLTKRIGDATGNAEASTKCPATVAHKHHDS
jgi:hypothetical protein